MGDGEGERGGERLKEFEMEEGREREKATQAFMLPRQGLSCWRSQLTLLTSCCPPERKEKEMLVFISAQGDFSLVCKLHLQFLHFASVMSRR